MCLRLQCDFMLKMNQNTLQIFANPGKAVGKGSVRHIEASDLNTLMVYMYSNIDSTQEAFE